VERDSILFSALGSKIQLKHFINYKIFRVFGHGAFVGLHASEQRPKLFICCLASVRCKNTGLMADVMEKLGY
jgi:hypothetical protein